MNSISNFCSKCGAPLDEGARFCAECGAEVTDLQNSDQSKLVPDQNKTKVKEAKIKVSSRSENPPPPKSTKKSKQDNGKTYSKDNSSSNKGLLIVLIILFLIFAGVGVKYVFMEQQSMPIENTTTISSGLSAATSRSDNKKKQASYIKITKQMLVNRVLYTKEFGGYMEISFLKPSFESFDGNIVFTSMQNKNSVVGDKEELSYQLKDGRIIYYSNSGSSYRITLVSSAPNSWIMLEEEEYDRYGYDDKPFGYTQSVKKSYYFYYLKKPKDYPRLEDCKPISDCQCSVATSPSMEK